MNFMSHLKWTNQDLLLLVCLFFFNCQLCHVTTPQGCLFGVTSNLRCTSPLHGKPRAAAVFNKTLAKARWEESENIFSTKKLLVPFFVLILM